MNTIDRAQYDVVISGGGLAALWLSLQLARATPWKILIIERMAAAGGMPDALSAPSLAFSSATLHELPSLGVHVSCVPIKTIHVSQSGAFGSSVLSADQQGVESLGGVVEVAPLYRALLDQVARSDQIEMVNESSLHQMNRSLDSITLDVNCHGQGTSVDCKLLVAADGHESATRALLGIDVRRSDYGQVAMVTNVQLDQPNRYCAYERFVESGPRALLPLSNRRMALIWTVAQDELHAQLEQSKLEWCNRINDEFHGMLGANVVDIGHWRTKPLPWMMARSQVGYRSVLIGNAAHTLHPVAGQGFNLTAKDLTQLTASLSSVNLSDSAALTKALSDYQALREKDQVEVSQACDGLLRLFCSSKRPVRWARAMGLVVFDHIRPLKSQLVLRAMGAL